MTTPNPKKRQSIRKHIDEVCAPSSTLARSGFARDVAFELQKAYRIGLNNGKLLRRSGSKEKDDAYTHVSTGGRRSDHAT